MTHIDIFLLSMLKYGMLVGFSMNDDTLAFWENGATFELTDALSKVLFILNNQLLDKKNHPELAKKFFEEIAPVTFLAEQLGAVDILYTNDKITHNSFDAIISCSNGIKQKIECTCAIDGAQDALLDEYLDEFHIVSLNLPIKFEGTKRHRILYKQPEQMFFKPVEEGWNKICQLINEVINKKVSLNKTDYKNAILLVIVDTLGTHVSKLKQFLIEYYTKNTIKKGPFKEIFLIPRNPPDYKNLFIKLP